MPTITKAQIEMYYPNGWRPDEHFLLSDMFIRVKDKKQVNRDGVMVEVEVTRSKFLYRTMPFWDHIQPCDCKHCVHTRNCKQCFKTYNQAMRVIHWTSCVGEEKKEQYLKEAKGNLNRAQNLAYRAGKRYVEAKDLLSGTNWKKGTSGWLCPCFRKLDSPGSPLGIDWDDVIVNEKTGEEFVKYVDTARNIKIEIE